MPFPSTQGITTIDQGNPLLQRYGELAVSPDLAAQLQQLQQNGAMVGQDPFNGVQVPQAGDSLLGFLSMLHFAGNSVMASDLAQMNGVPQQDFKALMQQVGDATSKGTSFLSRDFLRTLGDSYVHNPLLMAATGLAAAGLSSPAAAAGGSSGAAGATLSPVTTGPLATGGAITATPIAAGAAGLGAAGAGAGAAGGAGVAAGGAGGSIPIGDTSSLGNSWDDLIGAATGGSGVPKWVSDFLLPGINAGLGVNAANNASDAMVGAADRAIAENQRQFDLTRSDLAPWMTAGRNALAKLEDPMASFESSPDYGFIRGEGMRDIQNTAAAKGTLKSGNALRALTDFTTNLAKGDFNNWWNRQAGVAGVGQNTAVNLGSFGANSAANTGNYLTNQGDARASGILGRNAAVGGGLNDILTNLIYARGRRNSLPVYGG